MHDDSFPKPDTAFFCHEGKIRDFFFFPTAEQQIPERLKHAKEQFYLLCPQRGGIFQRIKGQVKLRIPAHLHRSSKKFRALNTSSSQCSEAN